MADLGELVVRIRADATQLEQEMKKANGVVQQSANGIKSEMSAVGTAIKSYLGVQTVRTVIQLTDSWTMMQGKLKMVTSGTADLANTSERLFKIAQETRADLGATATLYQRVALAANRLGIEQEQIFLFTEQLNKQLVLGGLSSAEAASGVLQLTQAISKGVLNGDEFRTVLETMPLVMEALEKQTGRTRGELLKMSEDGKLTADLIVEAINGMADKTNQRFSDMPQTFDQALQKLENSFTKFLGENSLITSYVANLGHGLEGITKIIGDIGNGLGYVSQSLAAAGIEVGARAGYIDRDVADEALLGDRTPLKIDVPNTNGKKPRPSRSGSGKSEAKQIAEDYDKAGDALENYLNKLRQEGELAGLSGKALEERRAILEANAIAMRENTLLSPEMQAQIVAEVDATYDLKEAQDKLRKSQEEAAETAREWRKELTDGLTDAILHFDSARDAAKRFFEEIASQILKKQVTGPLVDSLLGVGGSSGLLGGLFGGGLSRVTDNAGAYLGLNPSYGPAMQGFANGGNPPVGVPSIVGERGPEIIVPKTASTVLPNGVGMGVTVIQNNTFTGGVTHQDLARALPAVAEAAKNGVFAEIQRGGSASRMVGKRA